MRKIYYVLVAILLTVALCFAGSGDPINLAADGDDCYDENGTCKGGNGKVWIGTEPQHGGFSFLLPSDVSSATTITNAYFSAYCIDAGTCNVAIRLQDSAPDTVVAFCAGGANKPSAATWVTDRATGSKAFSTSTWYFGSGQTHVVDLASDFNTLFGSHSFSAGEANRVNVCIWNGADADYIAFEEREAAGSNDATLTLTYGGAPSGAQIIIISSE